MLLGTLGLTRQGARGRERCHIYRAGPSSAMDEANVGTRITLRAEDLILRRLILSQNTARELGLERCEDAVYLRCYSWPCSLSPLGHNSNLSVVHPVGPASCAARRSSPCFLICSRFRSWPSYAEKGETQQSPSNNYYEEVLVSVAAHPFLISDVDTDMYLHDKHFHAALVL